MPDMWLNQDKDFLFVAGVPGQSRPDEIHFPSSEADKFIEEAALETGASIENISGELQQRKTIEF